MKYHKCIIKKVATDLGGERPQDNYLYEVYLNGELKGTEGSLAEAKSLIDSDFDANF